MNAFVMDLFGKDMPNLLATFGLFFFSVIIRYYFMCKLLPNRLNIYALIAISFVFASWFVLSTAVTFGTRYHFWMNVFVNAWTMSILIFFFKGKFWRTYIVYWYFSIIYIGCEALAFTPMFLLDAYRGYRSAWSVMVFSVDVAQKLFYMLAFIPLALLMGFFSLKLWRRLLLRKNQPFYMLLIILPIGQRYAMAYAVHPGTGDIFFGIATYLGVDTASAYRLFSVLGIFVSIAVSAVLFCYILSHEKRTGIEAELREAKRVRERELARHREIEKQSDELSKIRHDFNNQLASVIQLVKAGEDKTAREIISALSDEISRTEKTAED
jgi:hypothetical protein